MNPKDIMTDAIHNFHPQYQQYTQYSSDVNTNLPYEKLWVPQGISIFYFKKHWTLDFARP